MIYEARPNVTVDAAGLALKSGNAVLLRGGSAAASSNHALVEAMRGSLAAQGLPVDAITLLEEGGRDAARALMTARGHVDLVIPRGGADLIQTVVRESTVPVIETGVGVCHVYVDRAADLAKAQAITLNAKTHRPSVCNAAESLLVHRDVAADFLPKALTDLAGAGVRLHVAPEVTRVRRGGRGGIRPRERGGLRDGVARPRDERGRRRRPRRGDGPDPAVRHGTHRGDRHGGPGGRAALHRRGRRGSRHGQREHPFHRRWRVRLRRRDRHLDAEAARAGADGAARADDDEVDRRGRRPHPR